MKIGLAKTMETWKEEAAHRGRFALPWIGDLMLAIFFGREGIEPSREQGSFPHCAGIGFDVEFGTGVRQNA
ncbi:MAG TPA: hypothetical protein PKX94_03705 [Opitutales bacterium]|nr:hypothetical protein [Opitutales bacterium]